MKIYQPDRFESDPDKRVTSCPVSLTQESQPVYSLPQFQKDYLDANTVKDQEKALIRFAKSHAAASDSPETHHKMEERLQKISEREH
tara:strand:+ start:451 stop:711 length:261 start_codon:yes stop_codon:yes gene_type:complete